MRPEARTIGFTRGHAHFYEKKKVDSMNSFCCKLDCIIETKIPLCVLLQRFWLLLKAVDSWFICPVKELALELV